MKKPILFLLAFVFVSGFVHAQKANDTKYGNNIISFMPFAAITLNSVGIGASYEGFVNDYVGIRVPVLAAINQSYFSSGIELKLYPTKHNGPVKYAIAPMIIFGTGDERNGNEKYDPVTLTYSYETTQRTRFGFLLNNTFNFTIMKKFYVGIDGGFGINYFDQEVFANGKSEESTSFLAQIHFSTGYRF